MVLKLGSEGDVGRCLMLSRDGERGKRGMVGVVVILVLGESMRRITRPAMYVLGVSKACGCRVVVRSELKWSCARRGR